MKKKIAYWIIGVMAWIGFFSIVLKGDKPPLWNLSMSLFSVFVPLFLFCIYYFHPVTRECRDLKKRYKNDYMKVNK